MNKKIHYLLMFAMLLFINGLMAQNKTVTGKVTDDSGVPLLGVNVLEKGTSNGTSTDFDGNYTINVSNDASTLEFTSIGYVQQSVAINGRSTINLTMAEDAEQLGEVVVTGLGITKEKKALGYATAIVESDALTQTATPNFATALYGKAPGVQIATTPGGSTSATNITIRGIASITGKSQPLIVLDGVPIRDGEVSNNNYWGDQRLRGNGLLDINPDDIENISILKGASAAALYGSEAVNGVVLITSKGAKKGKKGMSVDFNTSYTFDQAAYFPDFQDVRGPGYPLTLADAGQDADMFVYYDTDNNGSEETRGLIGTNVNFGPKFDGQPILSWDGVVRPYTAQPGVEGIYETAHNTRANVSVSNVGERSRVRFSYTRQDNEGVSQGAKEAKNIVNLNSSFEWSDNIRTDVQVNYINQKVTNRPYSIDRLTNNFGGMMTRFDNAEWYKDRYKTSDGYRYVTGTSESTTPSENIIYPGYRGDLLDYYWRVNENNVIEKSNRVIGIVTNTWDIADGLSLRGRISTDFTNRNSEAWSTTERPAVFYTNPGGGFSMANNSYDITYGELLMTYSRELTPDLEMSVMAGYNASEEKSSSLSRGTSGGLSVRNWFDIAASINTPGSGSGRSALVKDALLATANIDYKGWLYLEGTVRKDRTSTMNPDNNSFVYPSVNSSFVFSDAFELPQAISFAKLRASYGIVGNYPDPYRANIAYNQNTLGAQGAGSVIYNSISGSMGNDGIKPEEKREFEFGLDMKFFEGRLSLDAAYYNAQVVDQIIGLTLPGSSGASSILTNIGTLRNKGYEFGITGTPVDTGDFRWDAIVNFAKNVNKVEKLAPGLDEIQHANWDGDAAKMVSTVGKPMGDLYAHPIKLDDNGNKIVDPNGLYQVDASKHEKFGNAMPKWVGGIINSFTYKNFTLNANVDFRIGGHVMPTALNWMISRGLTTESLKGMDAEHGGLSFYEDQNTGDRVLSSATSGPNGEVVYDNGIVLDGVKLDGTPNDYIATNPEYYNSVYNWGGPQYSPNTRYELYIKENTYFKMRDISLTYSLPSKALDQIGIKKLDFSVYARNLFYIYRTIKDMDAEATTAGSRWTQNVNNTGTNPSTKSFGLSLRASL
ncbi:SusC/RagA family TonB-linked outer membrane protein [Cellulophaga sp. F20128]|uniref:SusC/RagA family TonB-linked outer membrane protein n=1 Tax=Cellulophaga sp. F20128 TaxID=2926413 RepID=UPI001FF10C0E|nr:SusC/RagA family TonB-linked outer membrane protein [Cellulophaga sp. F20128]MCK0156441.1 SusC/RagA family TonB-linked outer membrane protein [Cellulophaga sp. F20128]